MININKIYQKVIKDIMRYGDTKKVVVKIKECENEDIIYDYDLEGNVDKYKLPYEEEDGWVYYTQSLQMLENMLKYEIEDRKERRNFVRII